MNSLNNKTKYLMKNVILFTLSSFIPKLLTFLLTKVYTEILLPEEYGIFDIINTTASLLIPLLTIDIQDAVLRFAMEKRYEKSKILGAALKMQVVSFLFLIIICVLLNFFGLFNVSSYFYVFLVLYFLSGSLQNIFTFFCKAIDKVSNIVVSSCISVLITTILNLLFLIVLKWGIVGFLLANSIGTIIADIFLFISAKLYKNIRIKKNNLLPTMMKYSWPLVFNSVSWWINNASDRYILTWYSGVEASGIYAVSYKIPGILTTFQNIFFQAWSISAIKDFDKTDKDGFIGKMYTMMNFSMVLICSLLMILNTPIANFLYSKNFNIAWMYVPPLLISVVFNSLCLFIGGILTAVKDTKAISLSTIIGAIINILLNFVLIWKYSAYGAAIATMISYFIVFLIRLKVLKKHIAMKTNMLTNWISYILLLFQMILAYFNNKFILLQLLLLASIVIVYFRDIRKNLCAIKSKIKTFFGKDE